jgi:hypothetical protein
MPHPSAPRPLPTTCLPLAAAPAVDDEPVLPPRACGWFDSSLDLNAGLRVRECALSDSALPLGWWLRWQTGPAAAEAAA